MQIRDKIIFNQQTKTATIMRDGIYYYLASEVGDTERDPMDVVKVFRDKRAVDNAYNRFVELRRIPLTVDHPKNFLDINDESSFKDGTATNPKTQTVGQYNTLGCKIALNEEAMKLYDKGIKELSCGWEGRFEKVENQDYDYVQHFVDFNHIAILPDGRGGSLCSITDNNLKILEMTDKKKEELDSKIVDTVRAVMDEYNEEKKNAQDECSEEDKKNEDEDKEDKKDNKDEDKKEDKKNKDEDKKNEDEDKENEDEDKDKDKKNETKDSSIRDSVIKEFSSVFTAIEKGAIAVKDCIGKSPEEIKQVVVKSLVKKDIAIKDSLILDAHYNVALENYSHPSWSKNNKITDKDSKPLELAINNINFLKK